MTRAIKAKQRPVVKQTLQLSRVTSQHRLVNVTDDSDLTTSPKTSKNAVVSSWKLFQLIYSL